MNRKMENSFLYVEVNDCGAELMRIMRKDTGAEILWNGDPAFWDYRSPILFPNVGSTWQKKMKINGKEYQTRQHGFAREKEFACVESGNKNFVIDCRQMKIQESTIHLTLYYGLPMN